MAKRGRKSKYNKKYCDELLEYFNVPLTKVEELEQSNGKVDKKIVPNPPPTFEGFGAHIGVNQDTLYEWKKVHQDFSESWSIAKQIQSNFIVSNAMTNMAPSSFAKFMMQNNHGWSEKTENTEKRKITVNEKDIDGMTDEQIAEEIREMLN